MHKSLLLIFSELYFFIAFNEDVMLIQSRYIMINVHVKSLPLIYLIK